MNLELAQTQNPHWWVVKLLDTDIPAMEAEAEQRMKESISKGYQTKTPTRGITWEISGVAGEFAAHLVYDLPLNWKVKTREQLRAGDLSKWAEVKSCREPEPKLWNLVVNQNQLYPERAYINTITCWYPEAIVVSGWAWGHEIRAQGFSGTNHRAGHGIWILPSRFLHPPKALFEELEWRREKGLSKSL